MKYSLYALALIVLFSFSAKSQNNDIHDSLKKYSYLIIGTIYTPRFPGEQVNAFNLKPVGYGTGFFYKKGDSLFLISAAHIIYNIDVYHKVKSENRIDFLVVRYYDTLNNIRYRAIDTRQIQAQVPPFYFLDKPDVDYIFDPTAFADGKINTINSFLFQRNRKIKKKYKTNFFAYGYASYEQVKYQSPAHYDDFVNPSRYEGNIADSSHYMPLYKEQNIDSLYYTTTPKAWGGTSGSPVFKYIYKNKRKQWIEFAGIQSGKNEWYDCAYIVKKKSLYSILHITQK